MSDDSFLGRLRARLAPTQDADPSPQARDERPIVSFEAEQTEDPDRAGIDTWTTEYAENPLLNIPVRNFSADVMEPGATVEVITGDDGDPPTVSDHPDDRFRGEPLDEALDRWLGQCVIGPDTFDGDIADLLERVVRDLRGRRGAALVEHVYDDASERERLMGLRAFKAETTTAYTRSGKAILLRPDDDPGEFESRALQDIGTREGHAPTTPAGNTAAFVQYDDIFGSFGERDEIPFALSDVTFLTNDPDTGQIWGRPDTATVVTEAQDLREEFGDMARALKTTAWGHWLVKVDSDDKSEAKDAADGIDPSQPESLNVHNYAVETDQVFGEFPSGAVDGIQQQIEYVLTGLPTPLYRVGFAGDINRDITSEQREDYRDEVRRERDRLEAAFSRVLAMKAREFMFDDPHADQALDVEVRLVIEPEQRASPLADEEFDADAFSTLMQGVKAGAPGGAVEQVIPPEELRETILGLSPEPETDTPDAAAALPDETDPRVREAFADAYDADLATLYSEGDVVQTPQGLGVVVEVRTEPFEGKDGEVGASDDSPTYVVGLKDARVGVEFYKASQLDATEMPDTGVDDPVSDLREAEAAALLSPAPDAALADSRFGVPDSWEESDTPARLILLDAWASMGGQFDCGGGCCVGEMTGAVTRPEAFCASMKDRVLGGWEGWRRGG